MFKPYRIAAAAGLEYWPHARRIRLEAPNGIGLTMVWDGAAYGHSFDTPILMEAETAMVAAPHVEWHLGRILLMQLHDAPLGGIIWVTREPLVEALVRVLGRWTAVQLATPRAPAPPPMEVRLLDGTLVRRLGSVGRETTRRARWAC